MKGGGATEYAEQKDIRLRKLSNELQKIIKAICSEEVLWLF